ncbi:unnamed protein product [Orchesella dallaii]|uniref:RING-type domain-containing protein n=1 Tax=Orchesella dallaii TaxID=48710 RepID=A0ABP1RQR3_9HEXA
MSDSQIEIVSLGSEEKDSNFQILKKQAAKLWAQVYCRCRECPTPPFPNWDELGVLKIPKSRSGVLKEARAWAEYLSKYVRCPACPPDSGIPDKLYETGSCEHKFCRHCMYRRNLLRLECCVCDMEINPVKVKVNDLYSQVAVRLRNFMEDVDKEVAKHEAIEAVLDEESENSETDVSGSSE